MQAQHPAHPEHGHPRQIEGADVIEGARDQQTRIGAQCEGVHVVDRFPIEVFVGVNDALGAVRGARSVHEAEQIVGLAHAHRGWRGPRAQLRDVALRGGINDVDRRRALCVDLQRLVRDQQLGFSVAGDKGDLLGREAKVDWQKHRADVADREGEFEKGRAVFHQRGDDVACADALRIEPAGRVRDPPRQFAIADAVRAVDDRYALRPAPRVSENEAGKINHRNLPFSLIAQRQPPSASPRADRMLPTSWRHARQEPPRVGMSGRIEERAGRR